MALRADADAITEGWKAFTFNVPGLNILGGSSVYEYKLPYTIQSVGCCARISPWCYICDVTCCKCCSKGGPPTFMDMVDQGTGDQVRYRSVKTCCCPAKVMMFRNGSYLGHASRTLRCLNRCRTCIEDLTGSPVNMVGLHDPSGTQLARIERDARKCCIKASCNFPMQCIGCCFYCVTCTVAFQPGADPIRQGRGHWCCVPHGCLSCDPVCCEGLVRGPKALCLLDDIPCLAIGCPAPICCVSCPMAKCTTKPLETTSTIRLETHGVVSSSERSNVGMIQFQYRGNFPSSYTHDPTKPLTAAVAANTADIGLLASGVVVGKVYELGNPEAPWHDLPPRPAGRSPDFDGWVVCKNTSQMDKLKTVLRDDLVVQEDMVLGSEISGVQVKGWVLTDMGYTPTGNEFCGATCCAKGDKQQPRPVGTVAKYEEILKHSMDGHIGEYGRKWILRFRLPDHEKQVYGSDEGTISACVTSDKFNPSGGGFAKNMLEEVACECVCMRVWKFPCNMDHKYRTLCKIPLYAQKYSGAMQVAQKSASAPIQVVMNPRALAWK